MPVLNVIRACRGKENYVENLIWKFFTEKSVMEKKGFGVCDGTPQTVVDSFTAVRKTYQKINPIKIHVLELGVEYEYGIAAAKMMMEILGRYLYERGFQSYACMADTGDKIIVTFAINAVSYMDGRLFHDNNATYLEILNLLKANMPYGWDVLASTSTFFDPRNGEGQYVHGYMA